MKTEEDEAFEDLARRQGMWGGGFTAKRQAAMDKINAEFREEYIKYRTAFPKEYTAPQPAQEPVAKYSDIVSDGGLDPRNQFDVPKREWVGLTNDDWAKVGDMPDTFDQGVAWAAARLKEKNNGT
jgi:hypothetical protein